MVTTCILGELGVSNAWAPLHPPSLPGQGTARQAEQPCPAEPWVMNTAGADASLAGMESEGWRVASRCVSLT